MNRLLTTKRLLAAWLMTLMLAETMLAETANAQDFRVETDVYLDDAKEPFAQHLTLFNGSVVYDFALTGPQEITILDNARGKMVLLNVASQEKAELSTADLLEFTARIKQVAERDEGNDLLLPTFDAIFDEKEKILELRGKRISYRAAGIEPDQPQAVARYRDFADWYSRLNAMRPGNLPPFGRLELNRNLAEKGLLPEEIERTVRLGKVLPTAHTARSSHLIQWTLSNTDRRRIRDAGGQRASFTVVTLQQYLQLAKVAKK